MERIYRAVTASPNWPRTVLVFNYDEWGGFYDHVAPPTAPVPPATQAAGDQDGRLGFRVPTLVVSPWARRGYVGRHVYDRTSVLHMFESRWSLPPLTVRDQTANNLAEVLDFSKTNTRAPQYDVPAGPFGAPCGTPSTGEEDWTGLVALAQRTGWPV